MRSLWTSRLKDFVRSYLYSVYVMFDFELEKIEDNLEEFGCTYECVREKKGQNIYG